jgi:hypothetical protein
MVGDCFAEDFADIQPNQTSIQDFADYLVEWYIAEDSHFSPYMWAENSSSSQRTTNACEGFHSKFNASFYCGHPNTFQFTEVLKNFQIDTYIKIRSALFPKKVYRKAFIDKKHFIESQINKLKTNQISRFQFVKTVAYNCLPHAN